MPLGPPTIPLFEGAFAAHALLGKGAVQLATGCATGLQLYMAGSGCQTISVDTGTVGVGKGTGVGIILPEPQLSGIMIPMFPAHLVGGIFSPITADAISLGISLALATAIISTINAGVGVGAGIVKCVPLGVGGEVFTAAFLSAGMSGKMVPAVGAAVGLALDIAIALATGVVAIVGPTIPIIPASGVGIGTVT